MALSCSVTTRDSLSKLGLAAPSFCSAFAASTVRASAIQVYLATPCSVALRHSSNKFGSALALQSLMILGLSSVLPLHSLYERVQSPP